MFLSVGKFIHIYLYSKRIRICFHDDIIFKTSTTDDSFSLFHNKTNKTVLNMSSQRDFMHCPGLHST